MNTEYSVEMWFQFNNAGDFLFSLGGQAHSHPRGALTRVCPHSSIWGQRPPPYKRQGSPAIVIWTQMQGSTLDKPVSVWLCNPTDCCIPCSPALHHLPEPAQTHVHRVSDPTEPSHPLLSPSACLQSTSIRVFSNESAFPIMWQSIGASASVFLMNIQGWFPLGLTGLIL